LDLTNFILKNSTNSSFFNESILLNFTLILYTFFKKPPSPFSLKNVDKKIFFYPHIFIAFFDQKKHFLSLKNPKNKTCQSRLTGLKTKKAF